MILAKIKKPEALTIMRKVRLSIHSFTCEKEEQKALMILISDRNIEETQGKESGVCRGSRQ